MRIGGIESDLLGSACLYFCCMAWCLLRLVEIECGALICLSEVSVRVFYDRDETTRSRSMRAGGLVSVLRERMILGSCVVFVGGGSSLSR